jgi:PAS domain S-box-containing protein
MPVEQLLLRIEETTAGPASYSSGRSPSAAEASSLRPSERYVRVELHDQGGMGRVWLARDTCLGRDVALKELHPERAEDPAVLARFLREAQITSQLEHPGVAPVHELSRQTGELYPFYIMRFVKGRTLSQAVREYHQKRKAGEEASLDLAALLHAFVVVCNTVGYAHSRGVIHRDLKGRNVILGDFGEVIVLDWGLAKLVGSPEGTEAPGLGPAAGSGQADLTMSGQVLGTPAYMAPEQADGLLDRIDHRTDIYGLGAILYEILTGRPPFSEPSLAELLRKVRHEPPVLPREVCPEAPPGLESACLRALAKKPEDRFATAKELAEAVQQWQEAERRQAEEALRASEARFRLLADAIPQIVWGKRPDGSNEYLNERWFEYSGQTPEESFSTRWSWAEILHPDDVQRTQQLWDRALRTGEGFEIEYRLRRKSDGAYRWHLGRALPVRDDRGRIIRWFGTCTDIEDQKRVEEQLRASEERYRLLVNIIPQNIFTAQADGFIDFRNRRTAEYLGIAHEPVGIRVWTEYVHPEDRSCCEERWETCLLTGEPFEVETRVRRADGSYRWFLARGVPVRDPDGRILNWFGTMTDIDERKRTEEELARAEEALRVSEERYRLLADSIPQIVWAADLDGNNEYVNQRWFDYTGLTREQSRGAGWLEAVHPEDILRTRELWERAKERAEHFERECRLRRQADGAYRWYLVRALPLRDATGQVVQWFGTCTDIDDRKRAEQR